MDTAQFSGELLDVQQNLVRASTMKRFLNYIIDLIVFYILIVLLSVMLLYFSPQTLDALGSDDVSFKLLDRLLSLLMYALVMSLIEGILGGKTVGKFITGTRAVNLDGSRITMGTAFRRGFSRAVPFCAFSAFGDPCDPWQDRWNDTMVIDEKQSTQE